MVDGGLDCVVKWGLKAVRVVRLTIPGGGGQKKLGLDLAAMSFVGTGCTVGVQGAAATNTHAFPDTWIAMSWRLRKGKKKR